MPELKSNCLTLKHKVEWVLQNEPDTRNDDKLLTIKVWETFYAKYVKRGSTGLLGILLKDVLYLPSQDGIKRVRAHFQNVEKKYPPTSFEIAKTRGWREIEWRRSLGYGLPPKPILEDYKE